MRKGKEASLIGADTGFFYLLREGNRETLRLFKDNDIALSILTIFELRHQALKGGGMAWPETQELLEKSTIVIDIDKEIAEKAAHISHGTGIPAIDSLILSSLLAAGCKRIYTTDADFEFYVKKGIEIVNLKKGPAR